MANLKFALALAIVLHHTPIYAFLIWQPISIAQVSVWANTQK